MRQRLNSKEQAAFNQIFAQQINPDDFKQGQKAYRSGKDLPVNASKDFERGYVSARDAEIGF